MGNKSILSPDPGYEKKVGRNELCPCGSGRKSKNCRAH
ncbi:MAG: SEC-C metal-binding domain-containing protein [Candidatus Binatia bacterium]